MISRTRKNTDKQAQFTIRLAINRQWLVLVNGERMLIKIALLDIGHDQRQEALAHIDSQLEPQDYLDSNEEELAELLDDISQVKQRGRDVTEYTSQAGSSPPRMQQQTQQFLIGNDHDDDGDDYNWVLAPVVNGYGGDKGSTDGDGNGG